MRTRSFLKKIPVLLFVLYFFIVSPVSVFALSSERINEFSQNNILFYDPDNNTDCYNTSSFNGSSSAGLTNLQASFVDTYHDIAEKLSVAYGIPWETVVAQGILESKAGTSNFAVNRNNFFGIGAFDSNPDNAFYYDSPQDGWNGYYENIKKTSVYRANGVFEGEAITNPYVYLERIKKAGYATDPNYINKVGTLIKAVENRAKENGWQSSAELAIAYPEMINNAKENAEGKNIDETFESVSLCENGDINKVAIDLSWPDNTHAPTDPKLEYRNALDETGVSKLGDSCSMGGYSCDAFLATVMRFSGADPNFYCCGAASQLNYLKINPDLYEEIPNLGNTSNLEPGDIRASNSHVEIVVKLDDGSFKIASASHCGRTADHHRDFYADSKYKIFRKK